MKYRNLGNTGITVSEICMGAMTFGSSFLNIGSVDQKLADNMIKTAFDAGVNFFDTANVYSRGESEQILGKAIRNNGIGREEVVIATKVRGPMSDSASRGTGDFNNKGLSRKHIMASCDASLKRLGTDYIDLYQIHGWDPNAPIEETLRALTDLVRLGKVHYIGCSNVAARQLAKSLQLSKSNGWEEFVSLQAYYNVAGRDLEHELLPLCREEGLAVLPWSPLAGGFLTGKFRRNRQPEKSRRTAFDFPPVNKEEAYDVVDVMDGIAKRLDATIPQVALSWLLHQEGVTSVIIGARTMDQLRDNLDSVNVTLSADEQAAISKVTQPEKLYPQWMLEFQQNRSRMIKEMQEKPGEKD